MNIVLTPKKVTRILIFIVISLTIIHIVVKALTFYFGRGLGLGLLDLDKEQNIPTLYASMTLLFCSILLWIITFAKKQENSSDFLYWLGLAVVFLFLFIDETVSLHERISEPSRELFNVTSSFLRFAWVIPYGIFTIFLFLIYLKFIISLPKKTRYLFVIAGSIYVAGAISLELLEGSQRVYGKDQIIYVTLVTIEEFLEMTGIVIFIYALLSYISSELKHLQLRILFEETDSP